MPAALSASCANHAAAPAVATCQRCGLFLCDGCLVLDADESYCAPCAERRNAPASRLSRASLAAPVVALLCAGLVVLRMPLALLCLLSGPLWVGGIALGLTERRRLRADGENLRSQRWLRLGLLTSALATLSLAPSALVLWEILFHRHRH
jgi:hypothetical protein